MDWYKVQPVLEKKEEKEEKEEKKDKKDKEEKKDKKEKKEKKEKKQKKEKDELLLLVYDFVVFTKTSHQLVFSLRVIVNHFVCNPSRSYGICAREMCVGKAPHEHSGE